MIWFDLDNSPHVPLFAPVLKYLQSKGINCTVTARNFAQTLQLLQLRKIPHKAIGEHAGKNKIKKVLNLFARSKQLKEYIKSEKRTLPKIAVSHGSRTQLIAAKSLGIKSLLMMDYEYTETKIFNRYSDIILAPVFIPSERLKAGGINPKNVIRYNGFKEELYLNSFKPDENFRKEINVGESEILAVVRPPGMLGNYHDKKSEDLLLYALKHLNSINNCKIIITSRSNADRNFITSNVNLKNINFLEKVVDGLQLVYAADIVISGGGTMNRESALLGTETYSIFTGKKPYLDEYLQGLGRMKFINSETEIEKINPLRKQKNEPYNFNKNIVEEVSEIIIDEAGI
ncbi:MAG: DUF354 domain-containing protein [Ignavibacteria bacterium]|nr:DUF354 domain-containing protein [Ignavibacteria bacterium]